MTKAQLYTFVTGLLGDYQMDTTQFDTFLNIAQMFWEGQRPWMTLRTEDSSNSISSANTFTTQNTLPTDFRRWYSRFPIVLVDGQNNPQQYLAEVPISSKFKYQRDASRFYCNYGSSKFFVCGSPSQSLTAYLYYIKKSTLVSVASTNEWIFPSEYHPILGLSIAVYWKLGVDYDLINNSQADANASLARAIFSQMEEWDSQLQAGTLEGQEYGQTANGWRGDSGGGNVPQILD